MFFRIFQRNPSTLPLEFISMRPRTLFSVFPLRNEFAKKMSVYSPKKKKKISKKTGITKIAQKFRAWSNQEKDIKKKYSEFHD